MSVLNGGLPKWESEKRPIESGDPKPVKPATYNVPTLNKDLVRDYAAMLANAKSGGQDMQVLDARSRERFTGDAPEPRPGLSSGHMPGSISFPFNKVIRDGQLLSDDELSKLFQGIDLDKQIVTSCGKNTFFLTFFFFGAIGCDLIHSRLSRKRYHRISPVLCS